ncbi:hypothetical protein llap_10754 [Limosa lapponica baueri]|uniref:Lysozyme g n=1 Tax=Limosa lapponica baueri TaxID=1758121 RepID=A0A2I0TYQ7_LIMLA|nr:hypothetical protein llap_10754 [Limosa lapponica baueri]
MEETFSFRRSLYPPNKEEIKADGAPITCFSSHHHSLKLAAASSARGLLGQLRKAITMIPALLLLGLMALVGELRATFPVERQQQRTTNMWSRLLRSHPLPLIILGCFLFETGVTPLRHPLKGKARVLDGRVCKSTFSYAAGLAMVQRTAEADIVRLRKYEMPIKRVARNLCLDPALIAAIISQESRAGLLLENGWDQGRQKYGLMQIGRQQHQPFGMWDSEEHINQCSTILVLAINEVRARHPSWTWDQQLRGGICTYRAKMGNFQVYEDDPCDRDNYYVNSVIRRAQYFKTHGF